MSNPRIIQNNGQRLYLRLYNPGGGGSGINQLTGDVIAGPGTGSVNAQLAAIFTAGTYGDSTHTMQLVIDSKGRITGLATLGIPGITGTCMPKAPDVGILTTGVDQTSNLNTVFSNSQYDGMIMDFVSGGAVTISGTVNCGGKMLYFWPGCKFTGTGTINNAVLSAGYYQQLLDIGVSLTNCTLATRDFSSLWYGANNAGSADAQPALQKTSDTMIANHGMAKDLYMVGGAYRTDTTWMLHNWDGTKYGQHTINVRGDWRAANSTLQGYARVLPTFKNGPVIGVQRANSGMVFGISIEGAFSGGYAFNTFVQTSWATANTTGMRDQQFSPACGIGIDPVTNSLASLPPDGGYPTLNGSEPGGVNWYRGDGSNGGTSDFLISNCKITGFTVDIMNSPNGETQQGEDCIIEDCFLDQCFVAIAYGQSQNDNCLVRRCRSWDQVWYVIDTGMYGAQKGLAPFIDGYNVAGTVNTLFNIASIKPFTIKSFYAESFFTMGLLSSPFSGSSVQGNFNFGLGDDGLAKIQPKLHLQATNVTVEHSDMRYYDDLFNKRLRVLCNNCVMNEVMMDLPLYEVGQQDQLNNTIRYQNCMLPGFSGILGMNNGMYFAASANTIPIPYGKFKIQDGLGLNDGINPTLTLDYDNTTFNRFINGFTGAITITPDANRQASFTVSAPHALVCLVNDIVYDDATRVVIGRITNISGTTVTISEIPINVATGTYTLDLAYFITTQGSCVGDTNGGAATISNVCSLFSGKTPAAFTRFDSPIFPQGTYVVSYNSGTRVVTMSANATKTAIRQNFMNGNPRVEVKSQYAPSAASVNSFSKGLPTGAVWVEAISSVTSSVFRETTWTFSKGGYVSATTLGLGSAYQAEYNITPPIRFDGTNYQAYNTYTDTWTTL